MSGIIKAEVEQAWSEFSSLFSDLKKNIKKLGETVCYLLDNDPQARDKFRKAGITPSFYERMEKVGRGVLLPELAEHRMFASLPIDQQRQIVEGNVVAVVEKQDGTFDTIKVDILRADPVTAMRCIAKDHIRTPQEQRLYIESMRKKTETPSADEVSRPQWRVSGKMIQFVKPCLMTRADLLTAIHALEV